MRGGRVTAISTMPAHAGMPGASDRGANSPRFAALLALAALLFTAPRLWLHELWRDEAWLWIVATGSPTLPDLLHDLSRSGQGYLFPLLCWGVARLSDAPQAMQLLNLAIVVVSAYVLARWAPLRRLECVLLVFGYYLAYEYAVLSRHYALGMLLVFVACAALRERRSPVLFGLALGLLCQTTVYGFILALTLGFAAIVLHLRQRAVPPLHWRQIAWAAALAVAGGIAGLIQLIPESGTPFAVGWTFRWDAARAIETLHVPWRAILPVLQPQVQAWNSDILANHPAWRATGGVLALALVTLILWPRKVALLLFAVGAAGLLGFAYIKYVGTMRHHGHLWLLVPMALWLGGGLADRATRRTWREWLFLAVLAVHAAAMTFVSVMDLRHPFSNGERTAERIRARGFDTLPLLGYREPPAASVALPLRQPLYAPSRRIYATHTDWGPLQRDLTRQELRCAVRAFALQEGRDAILVMAQRLPAWPEIRLEEEILGAMVPSENYVLYRVVFDALPDTATGLHCESP